MFCRFGKWFVICALVASIGGHWAVLQSVAWMRMAVNYSQKGDVLTALTKTFDGKHPCKLCKLVSEGKKSERKSDTQLVKKMDFFALKISKYYFPPLERNSFCFVPILPQRIDAPPTPPPLLT